jgi:hypothetical protein
VSRWAIAPASKIPIFYPGYQDTEIELSGCYQVSRTFLINDNIQKASVPVNLGSASKLL